MALKHPKPGRKRAEVVSESQLTPEQGPSDGLYGRQGAPNVESEGGRELPAPENASQGRVGLRRRSAPDQLRHLSQILLTALEAANPQTHAQILGVAHTLDRIADTEGTEMTDPQAPALRALLEGKNAELKQLHLDARIGDLHGSTVQDVRAVLDQWAPEHGTPLHALWLQVEEATERYTEQIDCIRDEARRDVPGIEGRS